MVDSNFLAEELHTYVLADHTSKIKDLQNLTKERFNDDISYYKIWEAKQKGYYKYTRELERVVPKVAEIVIGI